MTLLSGCARAPPSVSVSRSRAITVSNMKEFLVEPLPDCKSRFSDSKAIKDVLLNRIRPLKFNICARGVIALKSLAVKVIAETVNLDELTASQDLRSAGLTIRDKPLLQPKLLVRNVPDNITSESMAEEICMRNLKGADPNNIKVVFVYPQLMGRNERNVVIEVAPTVRNDLIRQGRIFLGYGSCRVDDHVGFTQCYKCASFGHIAVNCREERQWCGNCMQDHPTKECRAGDSRICRNCHDSELPNKNHSAFEAAACPILARRIADRMRSINYSAQL